MSLFDKNYIAAFTDGSSIIKHDFYEASSSIVIIINGEEICRFGCYHVNGTNSLGEIYAMMLAIERVEEIKRDNPKLKNYETYFISDSKYVVSSLNEWIHNWVRINKHNNDVWVTSSHSPIMYQWIMKYLYFKYMKNNYWTALNKIIHTNGHVNFNNEKDLKKYFKKFMYRNPICYNATVNEYKYVVEMNNQADRLADKIRSEKLFYYEEREDGLSWEIRRKRIPTRNQRIIIKSRKNESKI